MVMPRFGLNFCEIGKQFMYSLGEVSAQNVAYELRLLGKQTFLNGGESALGLAVSFIRSRS
jgi:hypothetical protein